MSIPQLPANQRELVTVSTNEYISHSTVNRGHLRLFQNDQFLQSNIGKIAYNYNDNYPDFLSGKIGTDNTLSLSAYTSGVNNTSMVQIQSLGNGIRINNADTTNDYLYNKIIGGANVTFSVVDTNGYKQLRIDAAGGTGGGAGSGDVSGISPFINNNLVSWNSSSLKEVKDSGLATASVLSAIQTTNTITNYNIIPAVVSTSASIGYISGQVSGLVTNNNVVTNYTFSPYVLLGDIIYVQTITSGAGGDAYKYGSPAYWDRTSHYDDTTSFHGNTTLNIGHNVAYSGSSGVSGLKLNNLLSVPVDTEIIWIKMAGGINFSSYLNMPIIWDSTNNKAISINSKYYSRWNISPTNKTIHGTTAHYSWLPLYIPKVTGAPKTDYVLAGAYPCNNFWVSQIAFTTNPYSATDCNLQMSSTWLNATNLQDFYGSTGESVLAGLNTTQFDQHWDDAVGDNTIEASLSTSLNEYRLNIPVKYNSGINKIFWLMVPDFNYTELQPTAYPYKIKFGSTWYDLEYEHDQRNIHIAMPRKTCNAGQYGFLYAIINYADINSSKFSNVGMFGANSMMCKAYLKAAAPYSLEYPAYFHRCGLIDVI